MADLSTIQQQDNYSTKLAEKYDAGGGTFTPQTMPSFASGTAFYITVDGGTNKARSYKIDTFTSTKLTINGSGPVPSYEGESPTSIGHSGGATVIISNNFKFFDDIRDAINSKIDVGGETFTGPIDFSGTTNSGIRTANLTTAQRTALTGANGMLVYDTDLGVLYQYKAGAWATVDTGTSTPNGSTTEAGVYEEATVAEQGTQTATGGTGARLLMANANNVKTSSGAGDENKVAILNSSGEYSDGFVNAPSKALFTAKGSMLGASGANTPVEIPVGDNGTVPTADSTASGGVAFKTPSDPSEHWNLINMTGDIVNEWSIADSGSGTKTVAKGVSVFTTGATSGNYETAFMTPVGTTVSAGAQLEYADITTGKQVVFETTYKGAASSPTNTEVRIGSSEDAGEAFADTTNKAQFKFTVVNAQASAVVCDGTGAVTTANFALSNLDYTHIFRMVWTPGTSVVFSVDGTVVVTSTTNIPLNSDSVAMKFFVGIKTTATEANLFTTSLAPYLAIEK